MIVLNDKKYFNVFLTSKKTLKTIYQNRTEKKKKYCKRLL
jgi:hypothetical protein